MGGKEQVGQVDGNGKMTFEAELSGYGTPRRRRYTKEEIKEIAKNPKKLETFLNGGNDDIAITAYRLHPKDAKGAMVLATFLTKKKETEKGVSLKSGRKVRITMEWA